LHVRELAGCPDLVFPKRRKVIFVHGCFWHRHGTCKNTRWPKSKLDFWRPKLEQNQRRDKINRRTLSRLGWRVLVVWECQLSELQRTAARLRAFLEPKRGSDEIRRSVYWCGELGSWFREYWIS
jgi:DNA mismatch endonuclease (patch repair protein)